MNARKHRAESAAPRRWYRDVVSKPISRHQVEVLLAFWLLSFLLGVWGYWLKHLAEGSPVWLPRTIYESLHLFTFKGGEKFGFVNWQLEIARWTSPAVAAYTALKGLVGIFYQQAQTLRAALARGHVIVCGLSDKGHLIASGFLRKGYPVVVVDRDADRGKTAALRAEGAIIMAGEANEASVLRAAGVSRADYLITTCNDEVNVEVVHQARDIVQKAGRHLDCLVHISADGLAESLAEFKDQLNRANGPLAVRFFNVERAGARAMVSHHSGIRLDDSVPSPGKTVLVCGDPKTARYVLDEIAMRWMVRTVFSGDRMRVMPFSPDIADAAAASQSEMPVMWRNVEVIDVPNESDLSAVDLAFVLHVESSEATAQAIRLLEHIPEHARMVIRYQRQVGLARILQEKGTSMAERVSVFSMYDDTCAEPDLLLGVRSEALARLIHAAYLEENPGTYDEWDDLPEAEREPSREQADWIERMLEDAGLQVLPSDRRVVPEVSLGLALIDRLADTEHRRWCVYKMHEGWVLGPRDPENRIHPNLVPWEDPSLTEADKDKDRMFVRRWPRMLADGSVRYVVVNPHASTTP